MSATKLNSLKLLLQKDNSKNKPKVIEKNNRFTKKFLEWNKKMIKEGKTCYYADESRVYNPSTQKFIHVQIDKRHKNKIVYKKKFSEALRRERVNYVRKSIVEDKIYGFENVKYFVCVNDREELFENIKKRFEEKGKEGSVILHFVNKGGSEVYSLTINNKKADRNITIGSGYLDDFKDFNDRINEIEQGKVEGSGAIDDTQFELVLDVYNILYIEAGQGYGLSDKILFDCEGCDSKNNKCYREVIKKILPNKAYIFDKKYDELKGDEKEFFSKELENLTSLLRLIRKYKDIEFIGNTFRLSKTPLEVFKDKEVIKVDCVVAKKTKRFRLYKLNQEDIDISYDDKEWGKEYIIWDSLNQHFDYTKSLKLADNLYISSTCDIFKKNGDEYIYCCSANQLNKKSGYNVCKSFYVFFDYETIIDFEKKGCCQEYSISWFLCDKLDLLKLSALDREKDIEGINNLINGKIFNLVGYDCSIKFIDWIMENQIKIRYNNEEHENIKFNFVSYNGTNFDNIILLRNLLEYDKREINIDNIFYNGNALLNMRISGRHTFFDINKHLMGSLKNNCDSFKVNCLAKTSFDHYEAQKLHEDGKLIDFMSNNKELIEYNNKDVLSLAVILQRYIDALSNSDFTKEYAKDICNSPTIGGLIWKVASKYWDKLYVSHDTNKGVVNKPITFPKLNIDHYRDILKYKCAGRVELFNGIQEINDYVISLDICSMYPYVMSIMENAYYPYGEIIESEKFIEDKIGFYYCDIDQKILKSKNLPNIYPEKVFKYKKNGDESGLEENNWSSNKVLKNYMISSVMIKQLIKYGCNVVIKKGIYFSNKIEGYKLFKFILDFMKMKNEQDSLKKSKSDLYNCALRETLKLLMNSMSGKVIEGLHTDKTESVDDYKFMALLDNEKVEEINAINIIGNKVFASYKVSEESLINKQRPIYLGVLIYDYSKCYIYDNLYSIIGLDALVYTDTDAGKFRRKELDRKEVKEFFENNNVPHWKELEAIDERYKNFKLFNRDDKVFGSFEDELDGMGCNYFSCFQKKSWVAMNKEKYVELLNNKDYKAIEDGYNKIYKMSFKGVSKKSIILSGEEDFLIKDKDTYKIDDDKQINACKYLNENVENKLSNNLLYFCDTLHKQKYIYVLTSSFRRVIKNSNRKVKIDETEKFNTFNNTIQFYPTVKKIVLK